MARSRKRLAVAMVGALCIVIGIASIAFASDSADPEQALFPRWMGRGRKMSGIPAGEVGKNPRVALAYIAGKTGTSLEALYQEYKEGKTLEEIAEAYGVDWEEIQEVMAFSCLPGQLSPERLEKAIERVKDNMARLTERMETFESNLPEYEAKIAEIEDETLREFAERHLELMKQRWELEDDHLSIMSQRLELLEDELDYAKSR